MAEVLGDGAGGVTHLIVSLVGGGALPPCNADTQAPRLPHNGKHQLETEQTRGVSEGPVLSSDTSARASLGVTEELEEGGHRWPRARESAAQKRCLPVGDEALQMGWGGGKCPSTPAKTGCPA